MADFDEIVQEDLEDACRDLDRVEKCLTTTVIELDRSNEIIIRARDLDPNWGKRGTVEQCPYCKGVRGWTLCPYCGLTQEA